jgi:hypothetical protein
MLLKDLVLNGLEPFESYKLQYTYYKGSVKEIILTKELYEKLANNTIDNFYLDIEKNTLQPYISIKLKDN